MPKLSQGDIFAAVADRRADLAIIFGHIGFNAMHSTWHAWKKSVPRLANVRDPFFEISGKALLISEGQWVWFVTGREDHGMTDAQLITALDSALSWATSVGVTSVITNGIAEADYYYCQESDLKRVSDDRRARLLIQYASEQEKATGLSIELISLNTVFVRNVA